MSDPDGWRYPVCDEPEPYPDGWLDEPDEWRAMMDEED